MPYSVGEFVLNGPLSVTMSERHAYRASIFHCTQGAATSGDHDGHAYHADGLLVVEGGRVLALGEAGPLLKRFAGTPVTHFPDALLVPGFVDTHIHLPQSDVIASHGEQLLEWLSTYTFPAERRFADPHHAAEQVDFFLDQLLRNGTTAAMVFGSVHPQSVDRLFVAAELLGMCLVAGKVLMDRHAPAELLDTPQRAYDESRALIEQWHGRGRLRYAVTPRFAPTSSPQQLDLAGRLLREYGSVYLQTHLSESREELAWVGELFPERRSYLDVYDAHGLVGARSVFAHGIHLENAECNRLAEVGAAVAFCPSSNLFLGSGLLDLQCLESLGVTVGVGTDVGAGTSFSQLRTLADAYKVLQLQGQSLDPVHAFYLATLGGAKALHLEDQIGNLAPGKFADFCVLDLRATPLIARRLAQARSISETLFALMILGDEQVVAATYIAGICRYRNPAAGPD
ncbi:guanine deaminase [uncultured Microbulbifer sp.]|uniref:guanine deaminase n=1 Tax=uncultured Microbulbifer sp. TaxID=348147 RepID=UPI0026050AC9|nr:guanine deaminase [uncultured Microbulbifer sp.]